MLISLIVKLFELLVREYRFVVAAGRCLAVVADGAGGVVHGCCISSNVGGCTGAAVGLLPMNISCLHLGFLQAVLGAEWVRVGRSDALVRRWTLGLGECQLTSAIDARLMAFTCCFRISRFRLEIGFLHVELLEGLAVRIVAVVGMQCWMAVVHVLVCLFEAGSDVQLRCLLLVHFQALLESV